MLPFRPEAKSDWEALYENVAAISTSFQGLAVAMLFCFSNGEVQQVVKKRLKITFDNLTSNDVNSLQAPRSRAASFNIVKQGQTNAKASNNLRRQTLVTPSGNLNQQTNSAGIQNNGSLCSRFATRSQSLFGIGKTGINQSNAVPTSSLTVQMLNESNMNDQQNDANVISPSITNESLQLTPATTITFAPLPDNQSYKFSSQTELTKKFIKNLRNKSEINDTNKRQDGDRSDEDGHGEQSIALLGNNQVTLEDCQKQQKQQTTDHQKLA